MIESTNPKDIIGRTKPPLELVPPSFWVLVSMAFKLGAKKYGPYNWRKEKVSAMIYLGAALRHIQQTIDGEDIDTESGCSHVAHAAACMAIYLDAQATGNQVDDRPPKGKAADLIRQFTESKAAPVSCSPLCPVCADLMPGYPSPCVERVESYCQECGSSPGKMHGPKCSRFSDIPF